MASIWILSSISVASAFAYGVRYVHLPPSVARMICKTAAVGAMTLISALSGGPILLTLALAFGTLGDACLAWRSERAFLAGLVAFLLGHLAYVVMLWGTSNGIEVFGQDLWRLALLGLLAVLAVWVMRLLLPHLGEMRLPVLIYTAVILAMGVTALSLPLAWPIGLAIFGALMFIASDAILGVELFVVKAETSDWRWPPVLLWLLYWAGQSLIVLAILLPAPT